MEIIGRLDCKPETTSILLDDCMQVRLGLIGQTPTQTLTLSPTLTLTLPIYMQGFVHKLFCQKWSRFGAAIHYCKLLVHVSYLVLLTVITFGLKERPEYVRQYVYLPSIVLGLLLCLVLCLLLCLLGHQSLGEFFVHLSYF